MISIFKNVNTRILNLIPTAVSLLSVLICFSIFFHFLGDSRPSVLPHQATTLPHQATTSASISVPESLSLGTLHPGQSGEISFLARNLQSEPINVDRIDTSCPCMRIEPRSLNFGPAQSKLIRVSFDTSEDPNFRGSLEVDVIGRGLTGHPVFSTKIEVSIIKSRDL